MYAHRFSYSQFVGVIPAGMFVCHTCDNPSCVNPSHLFLGSRQDNVDDMVAKGRSTSGERNGKARLQAADVVAIRARYETGGALQTELAEEYGVSQVQISRIVNRKTWADLQP